MIENHPKRHNFIEKETRNVFSNVLSATALKYSIGFNIHGKRDCKINQFVVEETCPICSEIEDWNHVIKCSCVESKRNEYLSKIRRKLEKVDDTSEDQEKINIIISDVRNCFNDELNFQTNQELLGMRIFFCGTLVKAGHEITFKPTKIVNIIISDIRKFLNDESNFQTNQELLGMRIIFRGTLVKI